MRYCPNCGKELEREGRFCPHCGAKLQAGTPQPAFSLPTISLPNFQFNRRMGVMIICCLIVIFAVRFPLVKTTGSFVNTTVDGYETGKTETTGHTHSFFEDVKEEQGLLKTVYAAYIVSSSIMLLSMSLRQKKATKFFGIVAALFAVVIFLLVLLPNFDVGTSSSTHTNRHSFTWVTVRTSHTYPTIAGMVMCISILVHCFVLRAWLAEENSEQKGEAEPAEEASWKKPEDQYQLFEEEQDPNLQETLDRKY